jgi:hypothetical protein
MIREKSLLLLYYKLKTLHPAANYVKIASTLSCYRYSKQRKVGKPHFSSYKELLLE